MGATLVIAFRVMTNPKRQYRFTHIITSYILLIAIHGKRTNTLRSPLFLKDNFAKKKKLFWFHFLRQTILITSPNIHVAFTQISISFKTILPGHDLKGAKTLPPGQSLCTKTLPSGQNRESKAPLQGHKVRKFRKCIHKL